MHLAAHIPSPPSPHPAVAPPYLVGELSPSVFGLQASICAQAAIGLLQGVFQVWVLWCGKRWGDIGQVLQHYGKLWPFRLCSLWQIRTQHPLPGKRNIYSNLIWSLWFDEYRYKYSNQTVLHMFSLEFKLMFSTVCIITRFYYAILFYLLFYFNMLSSNLASQLWLFTFKLKQIPLWFVLAGNKFYYIFPTGRYKCV